MTGRTRFGAAFTLPNAVLQNRDNSLCPPGHIQVKRAMGHPRHGKPPTFLRQGLLIVLPVFVLAALGLFSLRQDRRLGEEDARERAQELVQRLGANLGTSAALHLNEFPVLAPLWRELHCRGLSAWPESEAAREWDSRREGAEARAEEWSSRYLGMAPEEVLFEPVQVLADGQLTGWPFEWDSVPEPPAWRAELQHEQSAAWQAAQLAETSQASSQEIQQAWQAFLDTTPPPDAQVNAQFALLRWQTRTNTTGQAVEQLCQFARRHAKAKTEGGLPIPAVAFALAARQVEAEGLNEPLFEILRDLVFTAPSTLTPVLLEQAKQMAQRASPEVQASRDALEQCWQHQERFRALMRKIRQRQSLAGQVTTNLWVDALSNRWLVVLGPRQAHQVVPPAAGATGGAEPLRQIRFFPKAIAEQAVREALRQAQAVVPPSFGVRAELEGAEVPLPPLIGGAAVKAGAPLLASMSGRLSLPVVERARGLTPTNPPPVESDLFPEGPAFALTVHLSDPAAFYARQTQRSLWFGALIIAVAAAAVIGYIRARRAFLQERQLNELKTNFVSSVSHELRAPIASVRLMAESLERGKVSDTARQTEYFRMIGQECRRLSSLVANVLDFSRIEQGRKEYELEPTDLVELVRETVKLMAPHAAEREIALREEMGNLEQLAGRHPELDGHAVQQALVNLIDNAFKHSPKNSVVRVGLEFAPGGVARCASAPAASGQREQADPAGAPADQPGRWRLWVQDEGPGIPAAEHERIFERFYRLGSELRRDTPGVGIGLSIVKHIVDAHQGSVRVDSAPGQGSRFIMEFPAS